MDLALGAFEFAPPLGTEGAWSSRAANLGAWELSTASSRRNSLEWDKYHGVSDPILSDREE